MVGILRIYQDSYGNNMGARTFCLLSHYFGGVLITNNKKIHALEDFKSIRFDEALNNKDKFTKIIVYNTKPNMFGGEAPEHIHAAIRLILHVKDVYYMNCDPILECPKSVPSSHELNAPGLTRAIAKINNHGTILSRKNCDLTKFLAARIEQPIIKLKDGPEKKWTACYFGDARKEERQRQVKELLCQFTNKCIIGHEHPDFAWYNYTPDFYTLLSTAWTTPIIGDKKMHYETGIPSIRLYEVWHTTTVGLIDERFRVEGLSKAFFFKDAFDYRKKVKMILDDPKLYEAMINEQQRHLRKLKKQWRNKKFSWKVIRQNKSKVMEERKELVKGLKKQRRDLAILRLEQSGIVKKKDIKTYKSKKYVRAHDNNSSVSI